MIIIMLVLVGCTEEYTVPNHSPGMVQVVDDLLMVAYGEGGLVISNENTGEILEQIFPPRGMNSIDDFAFTDDLIFVLDSRNRDFVAVYLFVNGEAELVTPPIPVEGGPFNGISARNGNLVIAGGTTFLNRFRYSSSGALSNSISFGRDRGHPDVLLSSDGQAAFISTDFGIGLDIERFGVMSLLIGDDLEIPSVISELGIEAAGFTEGVTTPIGFPIQTTIYEDQLLVAHGGGLTIIRLANNYVFESSSTFSIGINANAIAVNGNDAYITGYQESNPVLLQVDLSDPDNPIIISQQPLETNGSIPTSIAIGSNDVYVATGNAGLLKIPFN